MKCANHSERTENGAPFTLQYDNVYRCANLMNFKHSSFISSISVHSVRKIVSGKYIFAGKCATLMQTLYTVNVAFVARVQLEKEEQERCIRQSVSLVTKFTYSTNSTDPFHGIYSSV